MENTNAKKRHQFTVIVPEEVMQFIDDRAGRAHLARSTYVRQILCNLYDEAVNKELSYEGGPRGRAAHRRESQV